MILAARLAAVTLAAGATLAAGTLAARAALATHGALGVAGIGVHMQARRDGGQAKIMVGLELAFGGIRCASVVADALGGIVPNIRPRRWTGDVTQLITRDTS